MGITLYTLIYVYIYYIPIIQLYTLPPQIIIIKRKTTRDFNGLILYYIMLVCDYNRIPSGALIPENHWRKKNIISFNQIRFQSVDWKSSMVFWMLNGISWTKVISAHFNISTHFCYPPLKHFKNNLVTKTFSSRRFNGHLGTTTVQY